MLRFVLMTACAGFLLSGCAQQKLQQAQQQLATDYTTCRATFPEGVARANCLNEADAKYIPTTRYPDLGRLLMAKRSEVAERQAAGQITRAQAGLEYEQFRSQLASEEQRRDNADLAATAMVLGSMPANQPAPVYRAPTSFTPTLNTNCQTYGANTSCQTR
jgi:hypothetical protein